MSSYPSDWDSRRKKVYRRDNYRCQNCGAQGGPNGNVEVQAHHIVPKSRGGTHKLSNLKTLCVECHERVHGHGVGGASKGTSSSSTVSSASGLENSIDGQSVLWGGILASVYAIWWVYSGEWSVMLALVYTLCIALLSAPVVDAFAEIGEKHPSRPEGTALTVTECRILGFSMLPITWGIISLVNWNSITYGIILAWAVFGKAAFRERDQYDLRKELKRGISWFFTGDIPIHYILLPIIFILCFGLLLSGKFFVAIIGFITGTLLFLLIESSRTDITSINRIGWFF